MISLEGKIAIVTGSARGIGKSIALKLAKLKANLVISDLMDVSDTVKEIDALGQKAVGVQADVSNEDDVKNLIDKAIEIFGRLDILVNNAGITKDNLTMRLPVEDWDKVININLKSVFLCTKAAIRPMMKQKSGKIINIASIIGLVGNAGQVNYSASKAGVIAITKSVAQEVGSRNININAIAPGFIETAMTQALPEKVRNELLEKIPLKRLGSPEDVANLVAFLASDQADYITGQVFVLDGGMTMTG
ncbi:MAG: 3-oxoacyl-[acyl-carrier-protein] reductase [Spirochaetota bacterium]|nr:3-oxoacyl-[acyl-carrier-protein] reductase [Spirochaetota bacterium]